MPTSRLKMMLHYFCWVFWTIMCFNEGVSCVGEENNPLVIVYHPEEDLYALSDVAVLQTITPPPNSKIILLCPLINELPNADELFEIEQIVPDKVAKTVVSDSKCKVSIEPAIIPSTNNNEMYSIGYIVHYDGKILEQNGLANTHFPNNIESDAHKYLPRIYVLWLNYDKNKLRAHSSSHRFTIYNKKGESNLKPCKDYHFGSKNQPQENLSKYYEKNSQTQAMSKFTMLQTAFFTEHQLTPIEDFTDEYSRLATCTNMNTTPLWEKVSHGPMKDVENFIQMVAEHLPMNSLEVLTIAWGTLALAIKPPLIANPFKTTYNAAEIVYLDTENERITAPRAIIKLVTYRVPVIASTPNADELPSGSNKSNNKYQYYSISIVVHNEVFDQTVNICGSFSVEDFCELNGWLVANIKNNVKVYCCRSKDIYFTYFKQSKEIDLLNLRELPLEVNERGEVVRKIDLITEKGLVNIRSDVKKN